MGSEIKNFLVKKHMLILPFLLSAVLSISLYSVYQINVISLWTAGVIIMNLAAFALCEFVNKHHLLGGVILTVLIFLDLRLFFSLVFGNDWGESFQRWFLTGAEQVTTRTEYLFALLVSLVPFFAVVVYYFTGVLYRMSFLTLVSLIPCAVYVKVLSEIEDVFLCLIALLNVAILMLHLRRQRSKNSREIGTPAALLSASVFTLVLLVIASAVPKEDEARYYDRFEELFMDSNFTVQLDENYSRFSDFSGNADSYRNFSNRRMYTLYGDSVPYFKRQTFDYYDFERDVWTAADYFSLPSITASEWEQERSLLSLEALRNAMLRAEEYESGFIDRYRLERLTGYDNFRDEEREVFVQCVDFRALYFLSPARVIGIEPYDRSGSVPARYVTRGGVVRSLQNMHPGNLGYTVTYRDELISRALWFELGGADFPNIVSGAMLSDLEDILSENNDPLADTAAAFLRQHSEAEKYRGLTKENTEHISLRIAALAEQVAGDYEYDWEKATALQNYFINDGFVYDLRYVSEDTSPEHFLFESRRGSCSDFASAFALMARSQGLTVRYAEGYLPDITSRAGVFAINDSCSHAYPEVYIQNMGWVVFEPTVPSDYNGTVSDAGTGGPVTVDFRLIFVMCVTAGCVLVTVMAVILLYPVISDRLFIRKAVSADPGKCAAMIYSRIITRVTRKIIRRGECLTPREAAKVMDEMTGCDITPLTEAVESYAYSGSTSTVGEKAVFARIFGTAKAAARSYTRNKNRENRRRAGERRKAAAKKTGK